jgi:hypothetical protein
MDTDLYPQANDVYDQDEHEPQLFDYIADMEAYEQDRQEDSREMTDQEIENYIRGLYKQRRL